MRASDQTQKTRSPTTVQAQVLSSGSFLVVDASLTSSHKKESEMDRIIFNDLMRTASDRAFAMSVSSGQDLHIRILESHLKFRDTEKECTKAVDILNKNIADSHANPGEAVKMLGKILSNNLASTVNGTTLLMVAVKANNPRAINMFCELLNKYDDLQKIPYGPMRGINQENAVKNTALLVAAECGHVNAMEILAKNGANFMHVNTYKSNLLHLAVESNRIAAVKCVTELAAEYVTIDLHTDLPDGMEDRKNQDKFPNGPECAFWTNKEAKILPILKTKPYTQVQRDSVNHNARIEASPGAKELTRQQIMRGDYALKGFKKRRVILSATGFEVYEYLPEFHGPPIAGKFNEFEKIDLINDEPERSESWFHIFHKKEKVPATWYTNEEMLKWKEDPSPIQVALDKFNTQRSDEICERAASDKDKAKVSGLIGRRQTSLSDDEYLVSWDDKDVICSWHRRSTIERWTSQKGEKMVDDYDAKADQIVRLIFNQRNKYGKSAFISACEFAKADILSFMMSERWIGKDDYMQFPLVESKNPADVTCLHYAVKTSDLGLVKSLVQARNSDKMLSAATAWGDTPLLWLSECLTPESIDIARFLLKELEACEPGMAMRTLNHSATGGTHAMNTLPNATNNCLMRAAKAGNYDMIKLFLDHGADTFVNSEYVHKSTFKTAAQYAYEAKYFDVANLLDPAQTSTRLTDEFQRRCHTTSEVIYLSDYDVLARCCAPPPNSDGSLPPPTPESMYEGLSNEEHRYHNHYKEKGYVYSVLSRKGDLKALDPCQETRIRLKFKDDKEANNFFEEVYKAGMKKDGDKNKAKLARSTIQHLYELTSRNRVFLNTPSGYNEGEERQILAELVQDRDAHSVMQDAADHYMSHLELFGRISRLTACNEGAFKSFCELVESSRIYNVAGFCDKVLSEFYRGLSENADEWVLYKVMKMMDALTSAKGVNAIADEHFFDHELATLEGLITSMFDAGKLSSAENVKRVMVTHTSAVPHQNEVVDMGAAFHSTIIEKAVKLNITSFFGLPQIAAYVDKVLHANLMAGIKPEFPEERNIFSVRDVLSKQVTHRYTAGMERVRYSPINLFLLEGLSKLSFLAVVSYVSVYEYGELYKDEDEFPYDPTTYTLSDQVIILFLFSSFLREIGEFEGNTMTTSKKRAAGTSDFENGLIDIKDHFFGNVWNFLDLTTLVLLLIWAILKTDLESAQIARGCLSCAAIPMALALLRYAAIEKSMGNLVIIVISMSRDFYSFAMVFLVSIFGFGVAFRGLFQHDYLRSDDMEYSLVSGFSSLTSSFFSLIDGSVGNHDYGLIWEDNPFFYLGVTLQTFYILFTMIILFNLLIAKMSTTYANGEENALQEWEFSKATIVQQFLLSGECSPLSALPAPLNLITAAFYIPHHLLINKTMFGGWLKSSYKPPGDDLTMEQRTLLANKSVLSIGGSVADWTLSILFAPLIGSYEIISDVIHITVDVWRHYDQVLKVQKRNQYTGDTVEGLWISEETSATVRLSWLALTHISVNLLLSPFFLIYYFCIEVLGAYSKTVRLELSSLDSNALQIVYAKDSGKTYTPKPDFEDQFFRGTFVRGMMSRRGFPYEDRSTFVRVCVGPYSASTSDATSEVTRQLGWSGLAPENTKKLVSFSTNVVKLPLFPFNDENILQHMQIELVEKHSSGDIAVASSYIHGQQLFRWALDGRFEGDLNLVNHKGLPVHNASYPEKVLVAPPRKTKEKGALCHIRRKCSSHGDASLITKKGTPAGNPSLVTAIIFEAGESDYEPDEEVKVYHLVHSQVNFNEKNLTEPKPDGYFRDICTNPVNSGKFLYIGVGEENVKEDLDQLIEMYPNQAARLGKSAKAGDFSKENGYDTLSMVSLKVKVETSATGKRGVPILTAPQHTASLTVAFAFDLNLTKEYKAVATALSGARFDDNAAAEETAASSRKYTTQLSTMLSNAKIHPTQDDDENELDSIITTESTRFNKEWANHRMPLELFTDKEKKEMFDFVEQDEDSSKEEKEEK
jgi:ankyrin repeat protein